MSRKKNPASEMNVAEKQSLPLAQRLSTLITDVSALKDCLGVSAQAINQYKLGVSRPSLENLCKIADYYGVSVDYLVGHTTVKSRDTTMQAVCNYTGLSEEAVEVLHRKNGINSYSEIIELPEINNLLCSIHFWEIVNYLAIYRTQCQAAASRSVMIEHSTDEDIISIYKKDLRKAVEDKDLFLFRIQKLMFAIAQDIEKKVEGEENAVNQKKDK